MGAGTRFTERMLLRVSLVILALSVVAVAHNVDDVVPEVTLVHDEVVEKASSSIAHQCFLLRSKTAVQAAVSDGSGTGGEVETPVAKMEASSSFECSERCSQEPADSDFNEVMGFPSEGHESGSSFICRGHSAHAPGVMETTKCGKWSAEEKAKQCSAPTDGGEMVLAERRWAWLRPTGSFTLSSGGGGNGGTTEEFD